MEKTSHILLIEDRDNIRDSIVDQITSCANSSAPITIHTITQDNVNSLIPETSTSNEATIVKSIHDIYPPLSLVVVDHDLSNLKASISESSITAAAHTLAIPVCRYHRKTASNSTYLDTLWELNSKIYSIDIDAPDIASGNLNFAHKILNILDGFQGLSNGYKTVPHEIKLKGAPAVLAHILEKPQLSDYFAAYSDGVGFLNDVIIVRQQQIINCSDDITQQKINLQKRIPYILGYWLFNSILRFPGLILNNIAASSYLDIDIEDFNKDDIKDCFKSSRYQGPFSKYCDYWWRPMLDDMLIEYGDRNEILKEYAAIDPNSIKQSISHVSGESPAGYYDIFSNKPISKDDSVGNLSWIPPGADLARVDKELYEEIAPILGI